MADDPMDHSMHIEVVSTILRRERDEGHGLLDGLAERLARAVPEHVDVERSRGLTARQRRVRHLSVSFDDQVFRAERGPRGVRASVAHVVRGVVIRTAALPMDDWLDQLSVALVDAAEQSFETRDAIERLMR
jgi:hypothetical protein